MSVIKEASARPSGELEIASHTWFNLVFTSKPRVDYAPPCPRRWQNELQKQLSVNLPPPASQQTPTIGSM